MGCTNSNVRKLNHPEIPVEERIIQAAERLLIFNKVKLEVILGQIDSISYPIESSNLQALYETFKIAPDSPTGTFLKNTVAKKMIGTKQLRYLAILLSENTPESKLPLILCTDKTLFIASISELFHLAIEVIPKNLQSVDSSICMYIDQIQPISHIFISQLSSLSLEEIKEKLKETEISSREIRIKMLVLSKQTEFKDNLDSKFAKFSEKFDDKVQVYSDSEESVQSKNFKENSESLGQKSSVNQEFLKTDLEDKPSLESETRKINQTDETNLELKSFLDKIPDRQENEHFVDFNLSDDSIGKTFDEVSLASPLKPDHIMELDAQEPKEEPIRAEEKKRSVVDLYIERARNSLNSEKSPESQPNSKIPVKRNSQILTKLKVAEAFAQPSKVTIPQASHILGLKQSALHRTKINEPVELDPSLSESSILRSKTQKILEPTPIKKDSKILMKKEPNPPHESEIPDSQDQLKRRDSKIGSIKSKK